MRSLAIVTRIGAIQSAVVLGLSFATIMAALVLSPIPAQAQSVFSATCKTDQVLRWIRNLTREIQALDYQLAQAQVDLNDLDAREYTKTNYGPAEQSRHQSLKHRIASLQARLGIKRGELAQLEGLPPCGTTTTNPWAPTPSQPSTPPPGRPDGTH